ncbi:uncharacterized protein LOC142328186 [Lycorma delicatula]|uniref:uncharacterized protein LOC142328186 n=1 Tax=Lycorma delicatula TaxID=130591 RepID=UPI003F519D51
MALCFKTGSTTVVASPSNNSTPQLGYSLNPKGNGEVVPPTPQQNGVSYPKISSPTHDYENLIRVIPTRKAPKPPAPTPLNTSTYATLATHQGLEGIPFVLNPKYSLSSNTNNTPSQLLVIKAKTKYQIDKEFEYDFRLERQYTS